MSNKTATLLGIFALAAMPALAQTTSSGQSSGTSNSGQSSTSDHSKAGHSGHGMTASDQGSSATASKSGSGMLSAADRRFVMEAARGGMAEVELGKLATQKASNSDVKSFGQMMVDDHTKANDELKSIASSKGIDVPSDLDAKAKAQKARLEKLSGDEFDRAYLRDMEKDHRKDAAEFKREANSGKDQQLKDFASKTLQTIEKHLQHAEQTASAIGASNGATASTGHSSKSGSKSHKATGTNTGGK